MFLSVALLSECIYVMVGMIVFSQCRPANISTILSCQSLFPEFINDD